MISSLGFSSEENVENLVAGRSGLIVQEGWGDLSGRFCISKVEEERLEAAREKLGLSNAYTRLEVLFIASITAALAQTNIHPASAETGFILSSTKGSIELLSTPNSRLHLSHTAQLVQDYFKNLNTPLVVCNACISGLMAVIMAARLIRMGTYKHVIVAGADVLSEFILSGFESLKALSPEPCRPFDKNRTGINLGEGCATMILSSEGQEQSSISILGGSISNDANHISGPSRTGEGLQLAIKNALAASGNPFPDYISAHGTATLYNDEMEAKALYALSLEGVPLNSFKGYWGHTLGAAGLLETVAACHSLKTDTLIPSLGYEENGLTQPLNVIEKRQTARLQTCLKTSSGFGGCNAALVIQK